MFKTIITFLFVAFLATSCATKRTAGWDAKTDGKKLSSKEAANVWNKAMAHWKKRHIKSELEMSLSNFEKIAKSEPNNYPALAKLSRGYYLLADGHYEDMEKKKMYWEKGITWGEKAMATNKAFKKAVVDNEGKVEDHLDKLTKKQIESIYWTAANLGKWGKNSGIATILKYKTRIKKMINRVGELDKSFFHGAFHRYWGAYYAVAPGFAGGDINKSNDSFQKAFKAEKRYLGNNVLYAELYATKKGDTDLFKKHLNMVLKANVKALPAIYPENVLEQKKAKKLLAKMDDLF